EKVTNKIWEGDFDITVFGWNVHTPDPANMGDLLHSSGVANFGGYSNQEMDKMLEKAQETPVHQEREYYYKQVQNIAQEDAPFLLLQNWQMKHLRARYIAPFVTFQRNGRISFNYSQIVPSSIKFQVNNISSIQTHTENYFNKIYTYTNIHVTNYSLYFPYVDAIFTNLGSKDELIFNVRMSYDFQSFSSSDKGRGKFYEIKSNLVNGEYRFRCYYDPPEVEGFTVDNLYEFDNTSNSWVKLETHASNISLRFIEVHLKGEYKLLRVGEAILHTTYTFLPFIMLVLGTVASLGTTTILINRYMINQIKERFIFH
ncbi:MAG: hypothetical protein ACFFDT_38400, partial [Candidatus Hodarchaeota archaeon]